MRTVRAGEWGTARVRAAARAGQKQKQWRNANQRVGVGLALAGLFAVEIAAAPEHARAEVVLVQHQGDVVALKQKQGRVSVLVCAQQRRCVHAHVNVRQRS